VFVRRISTQIPQSIDATETHVEDSVKVSWAYLRCGRGGFMFVTNFILGGAFLILEGGELVGGLGRFLSSLYSSTGSY